jgi:hypothetical protein
LELVYIIEASGRQFIGDSIHFQEQRPDSDWCEPAPFVEMRRKILVKGSKLKVSHYHPFFARLLRSSIFNLPENEAILTGISKSTDGH